MSAFLDTHRNKRQKLGAVHHEIDELVNNDQDIIKMRASYGDNLPKYCLCSLLDTIHEFSNGHMVLTETAKKTLDNNPDLENQLQTAWKERSYQRILELDYFQPLFSSIPQSGSNESIKSLDRDIYQESLSEAWKEPFKGNHHKVLFQNINEMHKPAYYENICAIVQSSGTGKSRMVDEQAKLVYTLPINIRDDDSPVAAYPPADHALYEYLVNNKLASKDQCRTQYETFFSCLFHHATEELSTLHVSKNNLATKWHKQMSNSEYRSKFYQHVVKLCHKMPSSWNSHDKLRNLICKLEKQCHTPDKIKVVIYIDEAHELRCPIDGITRLDIMCSVISRLCDSPLFCLLLSTQSSLHYLAPTNKAVTSERARQAALLPPITETPFDCFPEETVKAGSLNIIKLSNAEFILKWGRPLWWSMWKQDTTIDRLLHLGRLKLLGHHSIDQRYNHQSMTRFALTAILDVLLTFDFEPGRTHNSDVDIEVEMVKSHMRIAYSVPQHRAYIRSGYPSEPLLAEAAAQQLWVFQKLEKKKRPEINSLEVILRILNKTCLAEHSLIDLGQRGELVMRMFLMRAYMDSVLMELGDEATESGIIFSRGCNLTTFIKELFNAPEEAEKILRAIPDNIISPTTFSDAFKDSMIRFTHFVKAGDGSAFSTEALYAAFVRGAAFIGQQNQKYVDFAIPVLLNKNAVIQESAMSAILIQVKRHTRGSQPTKWTFSQKSINLFPKNEDPISQLRPYILLVAELGMEGNTVRGITAPCVHVLSQPERQGHPQDTHPRYNFVTYGGPVYKYATSDNCAELLATRNFVEEHPRENEASRDLVMKLKPVWERGQNTYHWIELPNLEY